MASTTNTRKRELEELRLANQIAREKQLAIMLSRREQAIHSVGGGAVQPSSRYDAATRTRLRPTPRASGGSATKHLSASTRAALVRDCQDLERNSPIARIIIRRAQQLIGGDGPIVRSACKDKAAAAAYDRFFNGWSDAIDPELFGHPDVAGRLSFPEMIAANISAWCTDGDVLFLRTTGGGLQMVEAERVVGPITKTIKGVIQDGIELGDAGQAIAYHVAAWNQHGILDTRTSRRIEAEHAWLSMNPIGVRTGFVRGEPALQAVLTTIERLDSYIEKVGVAAEIATLFGAIVTDETPAEMQDAWETGTDNQPTNANASAPKHVEIATGTIQFMGRAGKVTQIKPEFPTTSFREYVTHQISIIAAELGLPLVAATYDSSQMSWSNIKAVLSLSYRSIEPAQARLARLVRWVRQWKIRSAIEQRLLPSRDDYAECTVEFPRAPVVDFRSEVDGYKAAVDARFMTRDQACQALGTGTFETVSDAAAIEESRLKALGIPAIQSPGSVSEPSGDRKPEEADAGAVAPRKEDDE